MPELSLRTSTENSHTSRISTIRQLMATRTPNSKSTVLLVRLFFSILLLHAVIVMTFSIRADAASITRRSIISSRLATTRATTTAWINPVQKIQNDYRALTRRVTARQILLPPNSDAACLELKRSILRRLEASEEQVHNNNKPPEFIVDVFEDAAKKFSRDDTTNYRGGLIGELVPQGTCRSPILDKACFEVPLGSLQGPIESEFGIHPMSFCLFQKKDSR